MRIGIGFLNSINRCNVMVSRARHGLVILGNARLLERESEFFKNVIPVLGIRGQIHDGGLDIKCEKHPNTERYIVSGDQFAAYAPEGGYQLPCNKVKQCTHVCKRSCHHDACDVSICTEKCLRLAECGIHPCRDICGKVCPSKCMVQVKAIKLACGHSFTANCWESRHPEDIKCRVVVPKVHPTCGHVINVQCSDDVASVRCQTHVTKTVPHCLHSITAKCHEDLTADGFKCPTLCTRTLLCGHACEHVCGDHVEGHCPQCSKKCMHLCSHDTCKHDCCKPCTLCPFPCDYLECSHGKKACPLPCFEPCYRIPCNMRCDKILKCGHQCPCVCGDKCAKENQCIECILQDKVHNDVLRSQVVDFYGNTNLFETYAGDDAVTLDKEPVIILDCGHMFLASNIDKWYRMDDVYTRGDDGAYVGYKKVDNLENKGCLLCRKPILTAKRYKRIVRAVALVDSETKSARSINLARNEIASAVSVACTGMNGPEWSPAVTYSGDNSSRAYQAYGKCESDIETRDKSIISSWGASGTRFRTEPEAVHAWTALNAINELIKPYECKTKTKKDSRIGLWCQKALTLMEHYKRSVVVLAHAHYVKALHSSLSQNDLQRAMSILPSPGATSLVHVSYSCEAAVHAVAVYMKHLAAYESGSLYMILLSLIALCETFDDAFAASCRARSFHSAYDVMLSHIRILSGTLDQLPSDYDKSALTSRLIKGLRLCSAIYKESMVAADMNSDVIDMRISEISAMLVAMEKPSHRQIVALMQAALMSSGLSGHVYYCPNRHPYVIGECDGLMEVARCPECGAVIGGDNHVSVANNERASELEH